MGVDKPVLWGRGRARDIYGAVRGSRQSQILRTPCWLTVTAGCRHIFLLLQIVAALHGQPWITLFQRFHPHLDPYPFCLCPNYFLFLHSLYSLLSRVVAGILPGCRSAHVTPAATVVCEASICSEGDATAVQLENPSQSLASY